MALPTQGFALSALARAPKIPDNVGVVDAKEIYDGVKRGLATFETVRQALPGMALADATMRAKTLEAPLGTRQVLAQTDGLENQTPLRTALLAESVEQAPLNTRMLLAKTLGAEVENSPEFLDAKMRRMLAMLNPSGVREFELMTAGMSPEDKERARRIHFGLDPRPSGAAIQVKMVVGSDGVTRPVAFDPRGVGAHVIGTGEVYGTGVGSPSGAPPAAQVVAPALVPAPAVVPTQIIQTPAEVIPGEAATITTEVPVPAAAPAAIAAAPVPVAQVAAPIQSSAFASPSLQDKKYQEAMGAEGAKTLVENRAKLPKQQSMLNTLHQATANVEAEIDEAIKKTTDWSTGYGYAFFKNLPKSEALKLDALISTIKANVGFDALAEMRRNSPTGGALGNVSDHEGKRLESRLATLDPRVGKDEFIAALNKVKAARRFALKQAEGDFERDKALYGLPAINSDTKIPPAPAGTPVLSAPAPYKFQVIEVK